jgi:hypothetical protein
MNPQSSAPMSYGNGGNSGSKTAIIAILVLLLVGSLAFGVWSYTQMQDYKNNSDKKSVAAVAAAKKTQTEQLQAQFIEQSKSPYRAFKGSATYGSVSFSYPKIWSTYVDTSNSSEPINAYFHPNEVPGTLSKTAFALRVELLNSDYSQVLQQLNSQITTGVITAKAYVPPKLNGVANVTPGTYLSGQVNPSDPTQNGNMLIIKVRDKTLKVYTESQEFQSDFNNTVLASLTFAP